jgi:hypothetical protein
VSEKCPVIFHAKCRYFFTCRKYATWDWQHAEDFFAPKNPTASAGLEPANLGTRGHWSRYVTNYTQLQTTAPSSSPAIPVIFSYPFIIMHYSRFRFCLHCTKSSTSLYF